MLECEHLLTHGASIADDAPRPVEHPLAFRGKALKTGTTVDQQYPEAVFKLLHAGRQGRLGHSTDFRRPSEMLFTSQGEEKLQLFQQFTPNPWEKLGIQAHPPWKALCVDRISRLRTIIGKYKDDEQIDRTHLSANLVVGLVDIGSEAFSWCLEGVR